MEFMKKYKIRKGYFGNFIKEEDLLLPEDIVFISQDKEYLGFVPRKLSEGYSFNDSTFINLHNIEFIGESPKIVSEKEFNSMFDFKDYYIYEWSKNYNLLAVSRIKYIKDVDTIEYIVATLRDYCDLGEYLTIRHEAGDIYDVLKPKIGNIITVGRNDSEYRAIINKVLGSYYTDEFSAAHKLYKTKQYDKLSEYINYLMKA